MRKYISILCIQSDGQPTGELQTGSWYVVENWTQENGWKEMPYVIDGEIGWEAIAWMIPMDDTVEWGVNWEWLYGELPSGKYRIGKEITDFREAGDYDKAVYFVEFIIGDNEEPIDELPGKEAFMVTNVFRGIFFG